jgi:hypothetical protein
MKYTGWGQNDTKVQGERDRRVLQRHDEGFARLPV